MHKRLWLGFFFLAAGLFLMFGCSSGHGGGFGNVAIHIERYSGPPPTDPSPERMGGGDRSRGSD